MITIAIDAMGGDIGPSMIIPVCNELLKQDPQLKLILVGAPAILPKPHERLEVIAAAKSISMHENPAAALRQRKDSSMGIALDLVAKGQAQACVSAGNTGALVALATYILKRIKGVKRPVIIQSLPTIKGKFYVLDLGANVDCDAEHLVQFALLGQAMATIVDQQHNPRIGLLNIGIEEIKGTKTVRKANEILRKNSKINYVGFVEGDAIYEGVVDVLVCDGFAGNIALKVSEGLIQVLKNQLKLIIEKSLIGRIGALLSMPALKAFTRKYDPKLYNGAALLGLNGIVIKSHGNADHKGFKLAVMAAKRAIEQDLLTKTKEYLEQNI